MPVRVQLMNFAEVEQVAVKVEPFLHATLAHRLRQMIHSDEARARMAQVGVRSVDLDRTEVDVEDRDIAKAAALAAASAPTVDKVDMRIANA